MQNNEKLIDALNELVHINYDRTFGYERACEDVEDVDVDLKTLFNKNADQSRHYANELQQIIRNLGGEPVTDSTTRGKLHRVWMDFKATLTGKDRKSALDSCAFGDEAAIKAYDDALETAAHLPDPIRLEIVKQQQVLRAAHDVIEKTADLQKTMS